MYNTIRVNDIIHYQRLRIKSNNYKVLERQDWYVGSSNQNAEA